MTGQPMRPLGGNAFDDTRLPRGAAHNLGLAFAAGLGIWLVVTLISPSTLDNTTSVDTEDLSDEAATSAELGTLEADAELSVGQQSPPEALNVSGTLLPDADSEATDPQTTEVLTVAGEQTTSSADPTTTDSTAADSTAGRFRRSRFHCGRFRRQLDSTIGCFWYPLVGSSIDRNRGSNLRYGRTGFDSGPFYCGPFYCGPFYCGTVNGRSDDGCSHDCGPDHGCGGHRLARLSIEPGNDTQVSGSQQEP